MSLMDIRKRIVAQSTFNMAQEVANIINENSETISSLLRSQLRQGKDGDGNPVTIFGSPYYKDVTVFQKERKGQETRWITNNDTGAFYASIYVYASGFSQDFVFDSDVAYFPAIMLQSGDKIMQLNTANLQILRNEIIMPRLTEIYNARVNGF